MPKVAPKLRRLRVEADLSTAELAKKVRVAEGTIRNIENGSTTASMRLIHRLARQFDVKADELVLDVGELIAPDAAVSS